MIAIMDKLYDFVWGVPALLLILGVGLWLTAGSRLAQIRLFPAAASSFLRQIFRREHQNGVSSFEALCTALGATVGIGNLAGVAGAIALGGPGAIFWMWICGILGMVIKFAEATLAVRYRIRGENGELTGGPMYMITRGMGKEWSWLASCYCFFGVVAAFGVGNATQINAVIGGIHEAISAMGGKIPPEADAMIGIVLAAMIGILLWGGAKRIGKAAQLLIPFAAGGYILLCFWVLLLRWETIPHAFTLIITGAFSPEAVTGGAVGSAMLVLRIGVSRGVFTNEAGMGTASIAHAGAQVAHPAQQGLMGIMEVFLDTIVICTLTALVILCSGVSIDYGTDCGAALTTRAFSMVLGEGISVVIALVLCLFAFATVLGWGLYGARCAQFLFGQGAWQKFVLLQMAAVVLGAVLNTGLIWRMAEIVNGLIAIPNLVALVVLSPDFFDILKHFNHGNKLANGGIHEDFH